MDSYKQIEENKKIRKLQEEYITHLEEQIARLTKDNGIVIIYYSFINLERFGFKKIYSGGPWDEYDRGRYDIHTIDGRKYERGSFVWEKQN